MQHLGFLFSKFFSHRQQLSVETIAKQPGLSHPTTNQQFNHKTDILMHMYYYVEVLLQ
jgi:hypothetical protein